MSMGVIEKSIIPMLDKLTEDRIPNIRFNVAKTYNVVIDTLKRLPEEGTIYSLEKAGSPFTASPRGMELIEQHILPKLEVLQKDEDVDVRYYATIAAAAATGNAGGEPMSTSP